MDEGRDALDAGQLVRALARSAVHVPMPGAPPESSPRVESSRDGAGPPLYVVEDDDGRDAFVYSTPRRLVDAFGAGVTAASVPFSTLVLGWPDRTDLVIDPGHADALEVSAQVLQHVALEIAGVPTGTSLQPAPGDTTQVPSPELAQIIGVTRSVAEQNPEVSALWRAVTVPARPVAPAGDRRTCRAGRG